MCIRDSNTILQAAFFQLTKVIPIDLAVEEMKQGNYNSYFKKGKYKTKNNTTIPVIVENIFSIPKEGSATTLTIFIFSK